MCSKRILQSITTANLWKHVNCNNWVVTTRSWQGKRGGGEKRMHIRLLHPLVHVPFVWFWHFSGSNTWCDAHLVLEYFEKICCPIGVNYGKGRSNAKAWNNFNNCDMLEAFNFLNYYFPPNFLFRSWSGELQTSISKFDKTFTFCF